MKDLYPRTVAEFGEHRRFVVVRCEPCNRQRFVPQDLLVMTFGDDFDLFDGMAELRSQLRCDQCGERHRTIDFVTRPHGEREVSFDESVARTLEFNALVRARDGERATGTRAPRRKR